MIHRLFVLCFCIYSSSLFGQEEAKPHPNVILIVADDLGYGDLRVYGGDVRSPNLERMAMEGLRFTDFHSNGAVCSPTRAALLTGRYQQRMGIERALGKNDDGLGGKQAEGEVSVAAYLSDNGYHTGMIGKWHLGYTPEQGPLHHGFDEFWGMLHGAADYHSRVNTYGDYDWWHNKDRIWEQGYSTDLITKHAVAFIEAHKSQPFFLYIAHKAIHFPWQTADDAPYRKEGLVYGEVNGPLNKLGQHPPHEVKGVIGEMIDEMDKSVGDVLAKLRELALDSQTLVLFCSDNGGIVRYQGGYNNISSNVPLRGAKGQIYEGGHRVPAIAWWPGKIMGGRISAETVMTMDILPTVLEIVGITPVFEGGTNKLDGVSICPLLYDDQPLVNRTLFWKHGVDYAARSGSWKLVLNNAEAHPELYDLNQDIAERNDLSAHYPQIVNGLLSALETWKEDVYADK